MVPQRDRSNKHWFAQNSALVIFLLGQALAALIWAVRTDAIVIELRREQMEQDSHLKAMDINGTRRLSIVDDRQQRVLKELQDIDARLDRLEMFHR